MVFIKCIKGFKFLYDNTLFIKRSIWIHSPGKIKTQMFGQKWINNSPFIIVITMLIVRKVW